MKKIIASATAVLLLVCLAAVLYGCSQNEKVPETTKVPDTTTEVITTERTTMKNDGIVTDESSKDDNGAIGDAITKTSENISEALTEMSEKFFEKMD